MTIPARAPAQFSSGHLHCAICGITESFSLAQFGKRLASDHSHENEKDRGFLCSNCNTGLGLFCDDPNVLKRAIGYLYYWRRMHQRKLKTREKIPHRMSVKKSILFDFIRGKISLPDALVKRQQVALSQARPEFPQVTFD